MTDSLPTHPASTDSPAEGGAVGFLLDRLAEFESSLNDGMTHAIQDWYGHVVPAIARLKSTRPAPIEPGAREKVARMIDPSAFLFAPDELPKGDQSQFNAFALADRIIALLSSDTGEG